MIAAPTLDTSTVTVALGERSYAVHIGPGELDRLGERCRVLGRRALVITNAAVAKLYGQRALASLREAGIDAAVETMPPGERAKKLATVGKLCEAAIAAGLDRGSFIVALGGGVVGDVAGFTAACLYRGVRFVQVPTTLVAMVDSSVGGKTGVNTSHGKNLVGAFWQPSLVSADLDVLASLPAREVRCGLAEVIKHGAILDVELFERLETELVQRPSAGVYRLTPRVGLSAALARYSVQRSCELKGAVVAADEREAGQRAWLNFGHTFGHALEAVGGLGKLHHGEAVSIGMVLAARLGQRRGEIGERDAGRIEQLCAAAGLPTRLPAGSDPEVLFAAMFKDKKVRDGRLKLVLLETLGKARVVDDVPDEQVRDLLREAAGREASDGIG
jgi:3-dehydroquinate synthase